MIVAELGLPHIIRSDNGPCYNSKEFQLFLQSKSIHHQTSSPNHPRNNGFAECIVGVAKKFMDKAGKPRKLWISGLFEYKITPQIGSIASSLQLMTQCKPRERNLPQLSSALGPQQIYQSCQELIMRQGNKPEREYQELLSGTLVWVHHSQNAKWEPTTVVSKTDVPDSYWIMCADGAEQPRIYTHTSTALKIISTPTDGESEA